MKIATSAIEQRTGGWDTLLGGAGNDLLIAGAGNDFILGDADYNAQSFDWTVTPQPGMYVFQPATGVTDPADSGPDVIYAGDGNDYVWAGGGNDTINATTGGGNDILVGGAGVMSTDAANDGTYAWRVCA